MTKIPFNWELYQSGKYEAVYRDCEGNVVSVEPQRTILNDGFYQFIVKDDIGGMHLISEDGEIWEDMDDENDVMLIKKS